MRLVGVSLPDNKSVLIALTYIHGVGLSRSKRIIEACGISNSVKLKDLSEQDLLAIKNFIDRNYVVEGELRKKVSGDIKSLISLGCYRGVRHRSALPVRGQRTHTNGRTRKGKARVALAGKKD